VGYGPHPNECTALVRERASVCLAGNHDLVVLGKIGIEAFVGEAAAAARWTAGILEPEARDYLAGLEPWMSRDDAQLYHGSPLDPIWDYVLSEAVARASFAATSAPLVLVGHSHVALGIASRVGRLDGGQAPEGTELELGPDRLLLNPGSVGQPRDGDPRAAWLEIDNGAGRARFRRTGYPVERTQTELRERGLPEVLAARLELGV